MFKVLHRTIDANKITFIFKSVVEYNVIYSCDDNAEFWASLHVH